MKSALVLAVCLMASYIAPATAANQKVLVLLDSLEMQDTHSKFLQNINPKAFDVTVGTMDTKSINLKEWDSWLFDKLVIIGGATKLGPGVKKSIITEFFNAGHDVVLAISETYTSELRDLAISLGVDVAPLGNVVIDHFNFNSRLGGSDHTVISSDSLATLPAVFSSGTKGPVLFKGVPLSISRESEVAFHAVTGSETAYSGVAGKPMTSKTPLVGKSLGLLTLVQGRNNARVAVSGSTDMLSNKFFSAAAGNAKIAADVLRWTFRQKSVLRASPLRHRIIETNEVSPSIYRINDIVEVAVDIAECTENVCKPFQGKDVQVEFTMLDPHVRTTLKSSSGNGTFSAVVKVPDTYGVFKWVLDYRRLGYSWLMEEVTVPVRPFRHYEYERFIAQAYPYYASAASMMAGFFALGFFFLYSAKESSSSK